VSQGCDYGYEVGKDLEGGEHGSDRLRELTF